MAAPLKIASWNINSVRARIGIVEKFLREEAPDAARQSLTGWSDGDLIALAQALSPATLDAWREQLQAESVPPAKPLSSFSGPDSCSISTPPSSNASRASPSASAAPY